jgi:hypothetical protein
MLEKTPSPPVAPTGLRHIMEILHTLATTNCAPLPKSNPGHEEERRRNREAVIAAATWLRGQGYLVTRRALAKRLKWDYCTLDSFLYTQRDLVQALEIVRHPDKAPAYVMLPQEP